MPFPFACCRATCKDWSREQSYYFISQIYYSPARFLSTFNSFSNLSKACWSSVLSRKGSFWSVTSMYSISEISDAALDRDWVATLLGRAEEDTQQLEPFRAELETGKFAVEGLCDFWPTRRKERHQLALESWVCICLFSLIGSYMLMETELLIIRNTIQLIWEKLSSLT